MPLPISKNQVRRLGERLRGSAVPSDADLDLLRSVLTAYDEALSTTLDRLGSRWGLRPADRLKNTGTIVEKLRREPRTNLASIQDIAGVRIVLGPGMGRQDQDRVRDLIAQTIGDDGAAPKVQDRRENPSQGYRAVHVIIEVLGLPVEVQIRTEPQHRWAQFFEKLADELGRGIRYGEGPTAVDPLLADERLADKREGYRMMLDAMLQSALSVADVIDRLERAGRVDRLSTDDPVGREIGP